MGSKLTDADPQCGGVTRPHLHIENVELMCMKCVDVDVRNLHIVDPHLDIVEFPQHHTSTFDHLTRTLSTLQ